MFSRYPELKCTPKMYFLTQMINKGHNFLENATFQFREACRL